MLIDHCWIIENVCAQLNWSDEIIEKSSLRSISKGITIDGLFGERDITAFEQSNLENSENILQKKIIYSIYSLLMLMIELFKKKISKGFWKNFF